MTNLKDITADINEAANDIGAIIDDLQRLRRERDALKLALEGARAAIEVFATASASAMQVTLKGDAAKLAEGIGSAEDLALTTSLCLSRYAAVQAVLAMEHVEPFDRDSPPCMFVRSTGPAGEDSFSEHGLRREMHRMLTFLQAAADASNYGPFAEKRE